MKKFMLIMLMVAVMFVAVPAFADTWNDVADTFTDCNDSCPMLFRGEVLKQFDDVMDKADVQIGIGYVGSIKNLTEMNHVELITRVIF